MSYVRVTGVSGGSVGEAMTAETMNIYHGPVTNIIVVQRQDENGDEFFARLQDLVSKLQGDTRLLSLQQETTLMLIGNTGAGKSSLGNTILGRRVFKEGPSNAFEVQSAKDGRLNVIDTPGKFHAYISSCESIKDIQRELVKSVVHVLIFVTKIGKYTEEEQRTVETYTKRFGVDCTRHMIVVFTNKDDLDESDTTLEDYVHYSPQHLRQLVRDCGDRYMTVNNRAGSEEKERFKLSLMDHINKVKRLTGGSGLRIT